MELYPGQVIHDIGQESFGILIRRVSSHELLESAIETSPFTVDELSVWQMSVFEIYAWEIVWSKGGHSVYSEDGLLNLIKCGSFVVVGSS